MYIPISPYTTRVRALFLGVTLFLLSFVSSAQSSLIFQENQGQWDDEVLFATTLPNGNVYFTQNGIVVDICEPFIRDHESKNYVENEQLECHAFKLNFNSYLSERSIFARNELSTRFNFLKGSRDNWASGVRGFRELNYEDVYPGISLKFYSQGTDLKYDIIVSPGSNLSQLKFSYEGVEISEKYGNLVLETSLGELIEDIPLAYNSEGENIECTYDIDGQHVKYLVAEEHDDHNGFTIDPILIFSTYSGATADNWGSTATFDTSGNLYSGGISEERLGGTFPTTMGAYQRDNNGIWDVAITKYDSVGREPIYSTLLGGSQSEMVQSLVVNSQNQLVVMGVTSSMDFPSTTGAFQEDFAGGAGISPLGVALVNGTDIFLAVLSEDGDALVGSTFFGGSSNDGIMLPGQELTKNYGDESRGDVYTDENDNILIASKTGSPDFPANNGFQGTFGGGTLDGIIGKFSPDLTTLHWSSYLGGTGIDAAYSVKKNDSGQIVIAGGTTSEDFHNNFFNTNAGGIDGWVAILEDDGSDLIAGRYMGTDSYDQAYFIDIDPLNSIYLFGQTQGNYPIQGNVWTGGDGQFIQKFSSDLSTPLLSTVFGNVVNPGPDISPTAFLVNDCGNIYVSGWGGFVNLQHPAYVGGTTSNLPVTIDAFQPITSGSDFYLAVFVDDAADLLYATYLGGNVSKTHVDGGTSRFDPQGIVYHAVCAGCQLGSGVNTGSSDFPTTPGAWSSRNNSLNCNNAAFKFDLSSLRAEIQTNTPQFDSPNIGFVCMPDSIVFENYSIGGETFEWDFGDGRRVVTTEKDAIHHAYLNPGNYKVKLKIIDLSTCAEVDSTSTTVSVYNPQITFPDDGLLCQGESISMEVTGAQAVAWFYENGSVLTNKHSLVLVPPETESYPIEARFEECILRDTVMVEVVQRPEIEAYFERECSEEREIKFFASIPDELTGHWDFGDGNTSNEYNTVYTYPADGNYIARFIAEKEHCVFEQPILVDAFELTVPSVFTPGRVDDYNDAFFIRGTGSMKLEVYSRWGRQVYADEDYKNNWTASDIAAGTYYYLITTDEGATCKGWVQIIK